MNNKSRTPEFSEIVRATRRKLSEWEQEIEHLKKSVYQNTEEIESKKMAPLLEYNAAVKIARLGAELLERSIENRSESLLLGLTQRPMIEGYVRGMWLQYVADEEQADGFLNRKEGTVRSTIRLPELHKMLDDLLNKDMEGELVEMLSDLLDKDIEEELIEGELMEWRKNTLKCIQDNKNIFHESIHLGGRIVWVGWSNEDGEMLQDDGHMISDLVNLIEIGSQCAVSLHMLSKSDITRYIQILQEKQKLRDIIDEVCLDPE